MTQPAAVLPLTVRDLHDRAVDRLPRMAYDYYASGAEEQALFARSAEHAGVPWQTYVNRNDISGGTTIGPLSATQIGVLTVDVGLPILSMHSARELCGADDPAYLAELALGFFAHT